MKNVQEIGVPGEKCAAAINQAYARCVQEKPAANAERAEDKRKGEVALLRRSRAMHQSTALSIKRSTYR
jgi:hypothetical protein